MSSAATLDTDLLSDLNLSQNALGIAKQSRVFQSKQILMIKIDPDQETKRKISSGSLSNRRQMQHIIIISSLIW